MGLDQIKAATWERRWIPLHPTAGEALHDSFRRERPDRSATNLWFDLNITENGATWVIPQFGGLDTEQALDRLAAIAPPHTELQWSSNRPDADTGES